MAEKSLQSKDIRDILEAVTQRESDERVIEIEEKTVQVVVILLDEHVYAFYGRWIKEIVLVDEISYVPGMSEYLLGVINVRGEIESVLDLRGVLALSRTALNAQSRVLIGEAHGIRSGLLVDAVEDVLEMPEERISRSSPVLDNGIAEYIIGESRYKEQDMILLDLDRIFDTLLNDDESD
ncbi:MAG: purine-binding chemotaxis protein CheW [bacterium]|nr:purine-binding chemotaxis protein CheW [bacterium]